MLLVLLRGAEVHDVLRLRQVSVLALAMREPMRFSVLEMRPRVALRCRGTTL